jgi:hypothetical protein
MKRFREQIRPSNYAFNLYSEKMDTGMASDSEREVKCVRKREMAGQKWRKRIMVTRSKRRSGGWDRSNEIREKKKGKGVVKNEGKEKANRRNGARAVVSRRELKDLCLVWGIGFFNMTMYREDSQISVWMSWRRIGDWRYSPTHSYIGRRRRRTVSIAPNR